MRYIYTCLYYCALPFVLLRLLWRSLRQPIYRKRMLERLGYYPFKLEHCIWIHAVSVGETLAAVPLIKSLHQLYPRVSILVTTMTATGSERVKNILGTTVKHVYIPYDLPGAVKRFLNVMQPMVAVIIETELWPNLIATCQQKNIPVCLMNARLSSKSAQGYKRIASLTQTMLQKIYLIAAQGEVDAKRFLNLGAKGDSLFVCGNIKFDLEIAYQDIASAFALRQQLGDERFIWVGASTHTGEEEILLAAHALLRKKVPSALLILVPRHPNRFDEVFQLSSSVFPTVRRSEKISLYQNTGVYLSDTMGELLVAYGASDVAFVGGSLVDHGGHNLLEPAALAKPILTGASLFNFVEISNLFLKADALIQIKNEHDLSTVLIKLAKHPNNRKRLGKKAKEVFYAHQGALAKQIACLQIVLSDHYKI